jgi:hypothetical protein
MTPAERVAVSRQAQGLPPTVTDHAALARAAALLLLASDRSRRAA